MYTRFSARLSIKYPPDTEYPIPAGKLMRPAKRSGFEGRCGRKQAVAGPDPRIVIQIAESPLQRPLFVQ